MRRAKKTPPTIRLKPKNRPPCAPEATFVLNAPSAVPSRYPPSTHVAVIVSNATHCGSERPATIRSDAVPCFTLRAASRPTARNAASTKRKTASAKLGFYLEAAEGYSGKPPSLFPPTSARLWLEQGKSGVNSRFAKSVIQAGKR